MTDTTKPTIAQRIIDHTFGGDGASRVTAHQELCAHDFMLRASMGSAVVEGEERYEFADGSVIETQGCGRYFDTPEGWAAAR